MAKRKAPAVTIADRASLPPGLAAPPWRRKQSNRARTPKPKPRALEPLPFEPYIELSDIPSQDYWDAAEEGFGEQQRDPAVQGRLVEAIGEDPTLLWTKLELLAPETLREVVSAMALDDFLAVEKDVFHELFLAIPESLGAKGVAYIAKLRGREHVTYTTSIVDPSLAAKIAGWYHSESYGAHAWDWLTAHARAAAIGLVPEILARKPGKGRDKLFEALDDTRDVDECQAEIDAVLEEYGVTWAEVAGAPRAPAAEDPRYHEHPRRMPKLPKWWPPAELPPLRLARAPSEALGPDVLDDLILMFAFSFAMGEDYIGLEELSEVVEPAAADAFAWALFSRWLDAGAPLKDVWITWVLARLGRLSLVTKLPGALEAWFDHGLHRRGAKFLEELASRAPSWALVQLLGHSSRTGRDNLRGATERPLRLLSGDYGLEASDALIDRHMADIGLAREQPVTLDFGPRQFHVALSEELSLALTDASGEALAKLPRARKSDDPAKAGAAVARWRALEAALPHALRFACFRLEEALTRPRRWTAKTWREVILGRPIPFQLARRLVWGIYSRGKLQTSFVVDAEGELRALGGEPPEMPSKGRSSVGLVHPTELSSAALKQWRERFAREGIEQPFTQLERRVVELPKRIVPDKPSSFAHLFERFVGQRFGADTIDALVQRGWYREKLTNWRVTSLCFGNDWSDWLSRESLTVKLHFEPGIRSDGQAGTRGYEARPTITRVSLDAYHAKSRRLLYDAIATLDEVFG